VTVIVNVIMNEAVRSMTNNWERVESDEDGRERCLSPGARYP